MFRFSVIIALYSISFYCIGQDQSRLMIKGDFLASDSVQIVEAHKKAFLAVERMRNEVDRIWKIEEGVSLKNRKKIRSERWLEDPAFVEWLGQPQRIRTVRRRILRIQSKFNRNLMLEVKKDNKGRCTGWISAWTVPFGQVRIRLCEDFFVYRTHLQEKVLIHEMGHEIGILFHRKVHGCRAARRAANSDGGKIAKKSTENYAWLAVNYLGISCSTK